MYLCLSIWFVYVCVFVLQVAPGAVYVCVFMFLFLCLYVFACMTPHDIAIKFLVPRAFQKYSTCMVYSDFLSPGKNSPLEGGGGGGGQIPIVN